MWLLLTEIDGTQMPYNEKTCQAHACSIVFPPKSPTSLYCGDECRKKMRHLRQLERLSKVNKETIKAKCKYPECNEVFTTKHRLHVFCSEKCKGANKVYGQRLVDKPPIQCVYSKCGKLFKRTNINQICCSVECTQLRLASPEMSAKRYPQGYFKLKKCRNEGCEKEFKPRAPSQYYCSDECKGYNSYYKRTYGITQTQYNEMKQEQDNVCYLCGSDGFVIGKLGHSEKLAVDHCHETGKVRKLLCHNCNRGLGLFQDNPELIMKAAEYLKYFKLE